MSGPPRFTTARIERKVTIVAKLGNIEHPSQIMEDVSAIENRFPDSCSVSFESSGPNLRGRPSRAWASRRTDQQRA